MSLVKQTCLIPPQSCCIGMKVKELGVERLSLDIFWFGGEIRFVWQPGLDYIAFKRWLSSVPTTFGYEQTSGHHVESLGMVILLLRTSGDFLSLGP